MIAQNSPERSAPHLERDVSVLLIQSLGRLPLGCREPTFQQARHGLKTAPLGNSPNPSVCRAESASIVRINSREGALGAATAISLNRTGRPG